MQPPRAAGSNELAILMELRLAFGPGTRLWANSSREDLCYEWLYFKAHQSAASLRDFARAMIARERTGVTDRGTLCEITRRVASVLRTYHLKTARKSPSVSSHAPAAVMGRGPLVTRPSPAQQAFREVGTARAPALTVAHDASVTPTSPGPA